MATEITFESERQTLALSLLFMVIALVSAVWSIAELAAAGIRRRRVRWRVVRRGIVVWLAAYIFYGMFLIPTMPDPRTVVQMEPAESVFGDLLDMSVLATTWLSIVAGLAAIAGALVTGAGSVVVRNVRGSGPSTSRKT